MDFFNDDFGFGDSPRKPPMNKNISKKSQAKGTDDFGDLLDQLLVKQKKKAQKQKSKNQQSFANSSFANTDKNISPLKPPHPNQTQKWQSVGNINSTQLKFDSIGDLNKNYEPMKNRPTSKSIYDDKGSQDNRSNKSGATAKASLAGLDHIDFLKAPSHAEANNNQLYQPSASLRGMKPPRRRNQSKFGSQLGQDDLGCSFKLPDPINLVNQPQGTSINLMRPPLPRKQPSPPQRIGPPQSSSSQKNLQQPTFQTQPQIIQKQKIVYVKQDQKNIRQQYDKQIKMIKQSHQKQMTLIKQELDKQIKNSRELKLKLIKQYEQQREKDRLLYEKLSKKQEQKLKQIYQWQIKRKSQSYELQIQRLRKISQIGLKAQSTNQNSYYNYQSQRQQVKLKQKQVQKKMRRLSDQQNLLKQKQRALQLREQQFNAYRKRQQQKIQNEKKNLYQLQSELQKKKIQFRKTNEQNKINAASDLSKQELELMRQKQQMKIQKQQLEISMQLFQKQKKQYEDFNANIMKEYKRKLKHLEDEKNYYQEKEIDLYKKIQTVEMMADLKSGKRYQPKPYPKYDQNKPKNILNLSIPTDKHDVTILQNTHNLSPAHHSLQTSKHNQKHDQTIKQRRISPTHTDKTNLKDYLLKVNRDNARMRPFLA